MAKSVKSAMSPAAIVFTLFVSSLCFCPTLAAQSSECDPALSTAAEQMAQEATVTISGVDFRNQNPLSDELRSEIVKEITNAKYSVQADEPDSDWIDVSLNRVRAVLQQQGYFKNEVDGALTLLHSDGTQREYSLGVSIKPGAQFRVGEIRVADAIMFSPIELRERFDMNAADLFDGQKFFHGLERIRSLYQDAGFIDGYAEPELNVDTDHNLINIVAKIHEGSQYHVSKVRILGLPPGMSSRLLARPPAGAIFNRSAFERFIVENASLLPGDVSVDKNLKFDRNAADRSTDVILDFREACSEGNVPVQTARLTR
jgi:outer membrane protein assembly factor BamA